MIRAAHFYLARAGSWSLSTHSVSGTLLAAQMSSLFLILTNPWERVLLSPFQKPNQGSEGIMKVHI